MASEKKDVSAGELIDISEFGPDAQGAFFQPFWDLALYDGAGKTAGVDGDELAENPWDCVTLGGFNLPGVWNAKAVPSVQIDLQVPKGYDGGALIKRGYLPALVTLSGRIWTPYQWRRMQEILR